ncbi:choice-of-anchor Q domain-containing protein [Dysgonomonas alginatilytica]|nr:choice-of-anchor Q domain-containing protein [Dysgonomonas alginatilytica]
MERVVYNQSQLNMKRSNKYFALFVTLFTSLSLFFSCDNGDNFSTDSNLRLSFSMDTLRFDTVFTTIGTATRRLKIYNRNKNALTINSVELMNAANTGFRMNVDGESGNKINNVDILGKDSMYIFVEVTVNPLDDSKPMLIDDSIRFQFNGVTQYVRLEAIGQDVILWRGKRIDRDTTLTDVKPYLIYDSLYIAKNATLSIKKNVRLFFHSGAKVLINGRMDAVGTIAEPVVFRGDRLDNLYQSGNVPFDRVPGQWDGIEVAADSYDNNFENVRIRNGIYGVLFHESDPTRQKATFMNTIVQNTTKEILWAVNCKITAKNTLFANSGNYTVRLLGGNYDFLHCTIANYMHSSWITLPRKSTLLLANTGENASGKVVDFPLENTSFINTIVAGNGSQELSLAKKDGFSFNYLFKNCLIKIPASNNEQFVNTVWNVDPKFRYIYSLETAAEDPRLFYYYNFELSENSPAINKGSRQEAVALPDDLIGTSRRSDDGPDIGCFEWRK